MQRLRRGAALTRRASRPRRARQALGAAAYKKELRRLQRTVAELVSRAARRQAAAVVVFEGWDASGKSGTIRRLVRAVDPKHYRVIPIVAPSPTEARHHFLWRFRRHLAGRRPLIVFDRSWYGRVLFERVEGLAGAREVEQAYRDIRRFEAQCVGSRRTLVKIWLDIDAGEQRARLESRARDPEKRHKLHPDDWRNLELRAAYTAACAAMFERTGSAQAPWVRIDANDKRRARLRALAVVIRALRRLQPDPPRRGRNAPAVTAGSRRAAVSASGPARRLAPARRR